MNCKLNAPKELNNKDTCTYMGCYAYVDKVSKVDAQMKFSTIPVCITSLDIYEGCPYKCSYCSVPNFQHKTIEEFSDVKYKTGLVEKIKYEIAHYFKYN